ncbi:MAG: malonyl-ACP O-methyltransferase BioC [Rikenellaceae bacterium]
MDRAARISSRFTRAIDSYDESAVAQRDICKRLFNLLEEEYIGGSILELGCGSGNLSSMLNSISDGGLTLNDLCPSYATILAEKLPEDRYQFIGCDAMELVKKFISNSRRFNLVASASAIQWFENPLEFIDLTAQILNPGGVLAISTFAPDNLYEITSITNRGLSYPTIDELRESLDSNFQIIELFEEDITLHFNSHIELLHHLKDSGVTATSDTPLTISEFRAFQREYKRRFCGANNTAPLTYKPIYILCKRV